MRIKEKLQHIIKDSLKDLNIEKKLNEIIIESSDENNTKYYTNIAITLSKEMHKKPEEIANILKQNIKSELIKGLEVIYPGTLNIYLNKKNIINGISEIIEKNINYGKSNIGESRKINIDFKKIDFEKNISTEELYNAIYTDNLSRILTFNGFEVTREYYFDDTSKEIDKLANITKERYINLCKLKIQSEDDNTTFDTIRDTANNIYSLYRDRKKEEDIDYFKKEEISILLEQNKRNLDKYRINYNIFTNENSIYEKGIIDKILDRLNKLGYTYFNEDKLWLKTTIFKDAEDRVLIENDGTYTKLLSQVTYQIDKLERNYDGIITIYKNSNNYYKNTIKPILKMLEQDVYKIEIKVLPNIYIEEESLLNIDNVNNIRYLFAKQQLKEEIKIDTNIIEKENKEIEIIENTNALIHQILKNYNKKISIVKKYSTIDNETAYIILNKIYEFEDIVIKSGLKQMPHLICNYLYELSNLFSEYYEEEPIITEDEVYTNEKLNLLLAIKIVMNNGLNLIGIIPKEEM